MSIRSAAGVVGLAVLAAASGLVSRWTEAADYRGKYRELLSGSGPRAVVPAILTAYATPNASAEIEHLGEVLRTSPGACAAALEALAGDPSTEAATVSAELLLVTVANVGGRPMIEEPLWQPVLARAVALLSHDDPVVRCIAACSLLPVRDSYQETTSPVLSPEIRTPCLALKPEDSLDFDFVLQAYGRGLHRTPKDLEQAVHDTSQRACSLAESAVTRSTEEQRHRITSALAALRKTQSKFLAEQPTGSLSRQRTLWLKVRRAARNLVLACPDLDFAQIAFFQLHSRTEGNHPDCLVQNHDRPKERPPGGDIYLQTGLSPSDPQRPLIAGQLGPGHVQDMDLWWDADRFVFAYVRQPKWGESQSRWGSVSWRNGSKQVVFDHVVGLREEGFWENGSEPTHLYEIRADGTGLRTLTNDPYYCDREPAYLPDGDVVFSSDRGCSASQCGAAPLAYSDFGLPDLYRVSADGQKVQRLTYNKDVDRYPHCLSNGLIGYMRWDYQERFWQWPHALWTIRPDGTMIDGLFQVHFRDPQSVREPRSIPGTQKLVVIACGHHSPPEGAVAVVDPSLGPNNPDGLRYVTPACSPLEGGLGTSPTVAEGGVPDRGGLYRSPWPLSEKGFLVAHAYPKPLPLSFGAYYVDVWGNKELIHRDSAKDALCPMPMRSRPRPPVVPTPATTQISDAVCYLDDVYRDLPGVAPGTVKYLRISEQLQWYFRKDEHTGPIRWTPGTQHSRNFGYWTWSPVRVIGTVPVEKDGSAYFRVPTGLAIYFQALDENRMEIRRMRSDVEFQPGESRSCVGCHETRSVSPRASERRHGLALNRPPSQPVPPPWGDTAVLDYEQLIQPILNRRCVSCHGANQPKKDLDLTETKDAHGFAQSYRSLFGLGKDSLTPLGEGYREATPAMPDLEPAEGTLFESVKRLVHQPGGLLCLSDHMSGPEVTQPMQFGSHRSRLVLTLLNDDAHRKEPSAAMTPAEWETLVTWVDANAPYHSRFYRYFDREGRLLPRAEQVRVELDPPFVSGEKTYRILAQDAGHRLH